MGRFRNNDWNLGDGKIETWEKVQIAVLMDIREELQTLNRLLGCDNFLRIPRTLEAIKKNTAKPRKRKPKP